MWGQDGGPTYVRTLPFPKVLGLTPADFKKNLHYNKAGAKWWPLVGPCGTLSFAMRHATCQTNIGPCPPLSNSTTKSSNMLPIHFILYGRTVSCHVAYTDCTVSICMFGKTYRMQYLSHTNSIWACWSCAGIVRMISTQWIHFLENLNNFIFEHFFIPWITPPHWESFGTPKEYFQSIWIWGYSSLSFPTSIHLSFLEFFPLIPTWRYSTFPHFEFLIFLSRIVSSYNFERYFGDKSSTEGI